MGQLIQIQVMRKIIPKISLNFICLCIAGALASGCASLQNAGPNVESDQSAAEQSTQAALPVSPNGSIRYDVEDERVAQLWAAAEQARLDNDTDQALAHLFSALELSPKNSAIWSRAAEIQLQTNEAALAETFAIKSNAFAGNNTSLLHRNWLIIEHARSLRGDLLGVRSAHKKVQEFQYR